MTLEVGDLVQYLQDPERLAVVTMVHTTSSGAAVCEVVIVCDNKYPEAIGDKKYLNQDYWKKAEPTSLPVDEAIAGHEDAYEDAIDLHQTYGES